MSDENINICINVVTKKSIREAGDKLDKLGKQGAEAGKKITQSTANAQRQLDAARKATAFLLVGLVALTAGAVKSLNAFKAFENGLINVQKVTNISGKNLVAFGKEIDRLANRIPVSTSELLNLAATAGQLGIEGAKDILAFTESVALLTRTTDLTVDSATKIAQLLAVSATAPKDIGRLSAVIVQLGNNFSATESQILEVSTRIAQSTTQFNILAEDSVALGAVIAGVGEKAEASGTAIGKTFRSFEDAINKGGPALEQLILLTGRQRDELATLFKSNPTKLLREFTRGINTASKSGQLISVILDDFGLRTDRVNRVLGPLIKNVDSVAKSFEFTRQEMENQNAAIAEARKQFASLESAEILTKNATTQLSKTIGELLAPTYRSLLETIRDVALASTEFFEQLDSNRDIINNIVIGLGAVGVALTAVAVKFAIAQAAASAFWSTVLAPLLPFIAAFLAIGAAVTALIIHWEQVKFAMESVQLATLELKVKFLDFFNSISFLQNRQTKDMIKQADSTREQIKLIKERRKAIEEESIKIERQRSLDATKIANIKELKKQQEDLRISIITNSGVNILAAERDIKTIDDRIRRLRELDKVGISGTELRKLQIEELVIKQKEIGDALGTVAGLNRKQGIERIQQIQAEIDKLNDLNKKVLDGGKEAVDELKEIEKRFQGDIENLRKVGNGKAVDGIKEFLNKAKEQEIKAFRDRAIISNDFNAARRAELLLDASEKERIEAESLEKKRQKVIDTELAKQEQLAEIKQDVKDLEAEEQEIDLLISLQQDEDDINGLQTLLEQKEILRLEAQKKVFENEKNHLAAMDVQRKINAAKEAKEFKVRSDSEIRQDRAKARVKGIIAQTSSQQLIGIGDNLFKAGILQGKTAGKALKTLKTSEALVNTYAGANLALATLPFPAGAIAAASVIASGLANIVTIQQQKFATGGIVQPISNAQSRGIDTVPALLSVGEEVLTRNNPRHRDNISRESDQALLDAVNGLREDMQNMQTIVNIDGKEVADVIQTQRFRGVAT